MNLLLTAARERRTLGFISAETRGRLNAAGYTAAQVESFILNTERN